jgi:SHS2 domain-containing protein
MVGDTDDERQERRRGIGGHREVPHTADVRVEAWGASREECLVEAALGAVATFAEVGGVHPTAVRHARIAESDDDDVLAAVLDEVVYLLEVRGEVPVDVEVETFDGALDLRLAVADLRRVEIVGAPPKAVSWNELHLAPDPYGWSCAATLDV